MSPRFGIVVFPGSNCDHDAYHATKHILGYDAKFLWHKDKTIENTDVVILPGGFSYGDYLRSGAIAKLSPIMEQVIEFAEKGGTVIGICNGFQVLTESGLLPGALIKNNSLRFECKDVFLRVENNSLPFTSEYQHHQVIKVPIAHGEGNYYADEETINELENNDRVVFRYSDSAGVISQEANPNGSINNIAGIINNRGNVLGLMPHPERCVDPVLGNTDGQGVFKSLLTLLN